MKRQGAADILAVRIAVGHGVARDQLATDLRLVKLQLQKQCARILQDLLEFTVLERDTYRLANCHPVSSRYCDERQKQPGTIGEPRASALFASFLHQAKLLKGCASIGREDGVSASPRELTSSLYAALRAWSTDEGKRCFPDGGAGEPYALPQETFPVRRRKLLPCKNKLRSLEARVAGGGLPE